MAKNNADYEKMLRYAQADLAHFEGRLDRTGAELAELLEKVPARERIMQLVEAHGANMHDVAVTAEAVERYSRLVAKKTAPAADATGSTD